MHNNESHLLMCTVPWSHMTMKWMTRLLLPGCCASLLHVEASTQVTIISVDGPPRPEELRYLLWKGVMGV